MIPDKALKLLRLGLDRSAQPGEIDSAAIKFFRLCRRQGCTVETLLGPASPRRTWPFGKFKGQPLDEADTGYLLWTLKNLTRLSPAFVRALKAELAARRKNL